MFCWNWYGSSQVRMITCKDRIFDNILLVGAGMRGCKCKTTGISWHRAPGTFGGRTKANLGSLLRIRHGFPQEEFVHLWNVGTRVEQRSCDMFVYLQMSMCVCEPFVMHESGDSAWAYATSWHRRIHLFWVGPHSVFLAKKTAKKKVIKALCMYIYIYT